MPGGRDPQPDRMHLWPLTICCCLKLSYMPVQVRARRRAGVPSLRTVLTQSMKGREGVAGESGINAAQTELLIQLGLKATVHASRR